MTQVLSACVCVCSLGSGSSRLGVGTGKGDLIRSRVDICQETLRHLSVKVIQEAELLAKIKGL